MSYRIGFYFVFNINFELIFKGIIIIKTWPILFLFPFTRIFFFSFACKKLGCVDMQPVNGKSIFDTWRVFTLVVLTFFCC